MTVRQLESMIRLSEALARLHCNPLVTIEYVREAARLLKASIIRVETDNIELSVGDPGLRHTAFTSSAQPDNNNIENEDSEEEQKRQQAVTYEEYMRIANQLVHILRTHALQQQTKMNEDDRGMPVGMTREQLIQSYLESVEVSISSVDDLNRRATQTAAIIDRLIVKDGVLIELAPSSSSISTTTDAGEMEEEYAVEDNAKTLPTIVVHPNFVPTD